MVETKPGHQGQPYRMACKLPDSDGRIFPMSLWRLSPTTLLFWWWCPAQGTLVMEGTWCACDIMVALNREVWHAPRCSSQSGLNREVWHAPDALSVWLEFYLFLASYFFSPFCFCRKTKPEQWRNSPTAYSMSVSWLLCVSRV